ncbi:hypothetical protein PTTG_28680 [Puccinia triticina 1-1 BBBD Race 1]|uniref:Uncharacterized protein n=1 Tax=Puccinia triticina (isolate 1-1 / race 1 (BBBD)) TaxID=630390 RepID=A0A180G9W0_PUCT1|nr:hypothetical protein PTTG_28680 [Puccinia triticina 1-1 BBBD Race 1]
MLATKRTQIDQECQAWIAFKGDYTTMQQERQSHQCVYRLPHCTVTLRPFPSSPSWPGRRKHSCSAKQKRVEPTGPNDWKSTGNSAKQEPSTKHQSRAVQVARARLARVDEGRALTISMEDAAEDKAPSLAAQGRPIFAPGHTTTARASPPRSRRTDDPAERFPPRIRAGGPPCARMDVVLQQQGTPFQAGLQQPSSS